MRFSKQFLQGEVVGKYKNGLNSFAIRIFFIKGIFCLIYFDGSTIVFAYSGTTFKTLSALGDAETYKMIRVNGFTDSDIDQCVSNEIAASVLNMPKDSWSNVNILGELPTGYIEPKSIQVDSAELQVIAIKATKYSLQMSNLLTQKGISHPSYSEFSAI